MPEFRLNVEDKNSNLTLACRHFRGFREREWPQIRSILNEGHGHRFQMIVSKVNLRRKWLSTGPLIDTGHEHQMANKMHRKGLIISPQNVTGNWSVGIEILKAISYRVGKCVQRKFFNDLQNHAFSWAIYFRRNRNFIWAKLIYNVEITQTRDTFSDDLRNCSSLMFLTLFSVVSQF